MYGAIWKVCQECNSAFNKLLPAWLPVEPPLEPPLVTGSPNVITRLDGSPKKCVFAKTGSFLRHALQQREMVMLTGAV